MARKPQQRTKDAATDFLAEFLKSAGMEVTKEEVEASYATEDRYKPREHEDYSQLQAEGVLLYLENRARNFMPKMCKHCKQAFSTMYKNVAYCSTLCAGTAMEKRMGIRWDYSRDSYEMMDAERPLIVGPQAYQVLLEMAQRVLDNHGILVQEEAQKEQQMLSEPDEELDPSQPLLDTNLDELPLVLGLPEEKDSFLGFGPFPF